MNIRRLYIVLMITSAIAAITTFCVKPRAEASCIVRQRAVYQSAYVAPVVAAVVPVAVAVPSYGASFDDGAARFGQIAELQKRLSAVESRLAIAETAKAAHEQRLAALEARLGVKPAAEPLPPPGPENGQNGNGPPPAPAAKQGAIPAVMARSCIQCHQEGKKVSGGLALVSADGKSLLPMKPEQRLEILRRTNLKPEDKDAMPPAKAGHKPVSDEEAAELMEVATRR